MLTSATAAQCLSAPRYAISQENIADELRGIGLSVDLSEVHLPRGITATIEAPKLEIVTAQPVGERQLRLELRCSTVSECLPFFAIVDVKESGGAIEKIRLNSGLATSEHRQLALPLDKSLMLQPGLRVGDHALLTIRDVHLDIHLQVLAVDTGGVGRHCKGCLHSIARRYSDATVTGEGTVAG